MAQRVSRRTVGLDVSGLAASNNGKEVSQFIVEHFAYFNIHAVQFIGTVAKATFTVEASEQQVISHQSININGVQCAVRGGRVVPSRRIFLFTITPWRMTRSPSAESWGCMGLSRVLPSVIDRICQMLVKACEWSAFSAVRPSRATFRLEIFIFKLKSLM